MNSITLPPWPLRARSLAMRIASSTATRSLPSTCRQNRPPAMPFCASVCAPVWAERGTEIAQPLLTTPSTSGSLYAPAEFSAA